MLLNIEVQEAFLILLIMEIKIKDTSYKLKYTLRALFIYEQITGKVFEMTTMTDEYLFLYCLVAANKSAIPLTFDVFF